MNESWLQILSLFLANAGLIIWFRAESRSDWRHMDNKLEASTKETRDLVEAIKQDMKDFHLKLMLQDQEFKLKLCKIEEAKNVK